MYSVKSILLLLLVCFRGVYVVAQYPNYVTYDIEKGLPSDEVYSIIQDKKGFLWIGCDAGLFKFDGIHYTPVFSKYQNSKSITGLTFSSSGRMYCYNFQSQLFYLNKDSLIEIAHGFNKIFSLEADDIGRVYVNHSKGIAYFEEKTKSWINITYLINSNDSFTSSSIFLPERNEIRFISSNGIGIIAENNTRFIQSNAFSPAGNFLMAYYDDEAFIFSKDNNLIFKESEDSIFKIENTRLNELLFNRKITKIKVLADGNLWICTFKGVIKYNPNLDSFNVYYPDLSFSDCIIDREGFYWFSTLQAGLVKVIDLNFLVWNEEYTDLGNDKIIKITTDSINVFFANGNGAIGKIEAQTNELSIFNTAYNADVQSLDYDFSSKRLYFNVNKLFYLEHDLIGQEENEIPTLKSFQKVNEDYFILSSYGVYIKGRSNFKLTNNWSRQLIYDSQNNTVWIATNEGVLKCVYKNDQWLIEENLLPTTQILSITHDKLNKLVYALSFKGEIFAFDETLNFEIIKTPEGISQVNKIQYFENNLYLASNSGLLRFDLISKTWNTLNVSLGLVSNSIQDLIVLNNNVWLATAKGVQKIPLNQSSVNSLAKIFLKDDLGCLESSQQDEEQYNCVLKYGQDLVLNPEVSHFASNGAFEYAYRINEKNWIQLPANIGSISIPNIPSGKFKVELKAIDIFGQDSENTILVSGFVTPPFWKNWWFILGMSIILVCLIYFIIKQRINKLKFRQQKEMEQLMLENKLRLTQQTALQAQMNPHFIFNVLNSIKGYIYENDKKNAALYLSRFSNLVRKILEQSSVPKIKLSEEIETVNLYIQLESMLLDGSFEYKVVLDEDIPIDFIYIPNLLIQPIVENAFKHGLRHKKGDKKLLIFIQKIEQENRLKIIVEDNGVGREASAKFNKSKGHESFASSALQHRIKLLNDEKEESVSFGIEDLKDPTNKALGTRVTLFLNI